MIHVPHAPSGRPTGAWRHRVATGRHDLALHRGDRVSADSARVLGRLTAGAGRVDLALRRCSLRLVVGPGVNRAGDRARQESAEAVRAHRRLTAGAGRVCRLMTLTCREVTPVAGETPLRWGGSRLPGQAAA